MLKCYQQATSDKHIFMTFSVTIVLVSLSHLSFAIEENNHEPLMSKNEIDAMRDKSAISPIKCLDEVFAEILRNKIASRKCCLRIVNAGKECHMEYAKLFFQINNIRCYSSESFLKTNKVWNRCSTEICVLSPFSR
ncbi:PREDICTED: uncharacterized protein LOC109126487 [Camelina sativa]|uniref:Uncharacterized protein LOC109126487 n=1 Tax=Camelina sativa TaxID=90675 RepID=A0ABM1QFS7_CAMSA|nr:PREDICTED: uncharacterized protein LOC109126487 [Camelina sativa]